MDYIHTLYLHELQSIEIDTSLSLGRDCTALFDQYHAWVNAEGFLRTARVGMLIDGPSTTLLARMYFTCQLLTHRKRLHPSKR
jgi:hypothetical protein